MRQRAPLRPCLRSESYWPTCQALTRVVNRLKSEVTTVTMGIKSDAASSARLLRMTVMSINQIGLRERKKLRTREALADAAFELFQRKGFEATTIDEIAEQVELSPRTFFRHFASKEDVALTLMERQFAAVYEAFGARPAHEPVVTALRHATVEVMRACEAGAAGFDPDRYKCAQQMVADNPSVRGRALEL